MLFSDEPLKPSKTNGNKWNGEHVNLCVLKEKKKKKMKRERERERKRESPALHEVSDKHEYLTPSRRRRGDGYQRASPASDPFTAAALLAQLDRDRALIN